MFGVDVFGVFYMTPEVVAVVVSELQGEDFCTNPDNEIPDVAVCAENIAAFMPAAMDVIGEAIIENDNALCNAWYDGVCPAKIF